MPVAFGTTSTTTVSVKFAAILVKHSYPACQGSDWRPNKAALFDSNQSTDPPRFLLLSLSCRLRKKAATGSRK